MGAKLNPILMKVKDHVESKLPDELKEPVERVVLAGQRILYRPETHTKVVDPIYERVKARGFQPDDLANGILTLLGVINHAAKGKMAAEAVFPAGIILMTYILDDLEQVKGLEVTEELVKSVGTLLSQKVLRELKSGGSGQTPMNNVPDAEPTPAEPAPAEPPGLAETVPSEQGAL